VSQRTTASAREDLVGFYDESYAGRGAQGMLYARWRALGAIAKADHVIELCSRAGIAPTSTLDVGCGDGALLAELHARGFGGTLRGLEITQAAVDIAARRAEVHAVERYDGERLPSSDAEHHLGIVSHVLEHVPNPQRLLSEVGRACRAVVVEVPLEHNLSARRAGKRKHAEEVGHLQRFSRASMRATVARAGLRIAAEIEDPLSLGVHLFFARGLRARGKAMVKWGVRTALHRLAPSLARRLFTVHYACVCVPPA
jgi:SAM-dependent methyltransferase